MAERRVQELLAQLDAPAALRSVEQRQRMDGRHVRALARRIASVPARRRRVNLVWGSALGALGIAAAAAGLWLAVPRDLHSETASAGASVRTVDGETRVRRGGASFVATAGDPLAVGDHVQLTPGASSTIQVSDRADVSLSQQARLDLLEVTPGEERLELEVGQARFEVGPPRGRFQVQSPHLEVEVTGTQFSVTVEAERSCVLVHSGRVIARSRTSQRSAALEAQQAFSSDGKRCANLAVVEWVAPVSPGQREELAAAAPAPAPSVVSAAREDRPGSSTPRPSTLEKENRLLLSAIAARREGRPAVARARLEQLLRQYPDTPLRAAAENELVRVSRAERSATESKTQR